MCDTRKQILIVDDDAAIRQLLRLVAERRGFTVDVAADGVEALQRLQERSYDLAVIDLMMPRLSGYEVLDTLGKKPDRPTVVVVTAMSDSYIDQLDASLVHTIIRKPFDVELIGAMMAAIIARIDDPTATDIPPPEDLLLPEVPSS